MKLLINTCSRMSPFYAQTSQSPTPIFSLYQAQVLFLSKNSMKKLDSSELKKIKNLKGEMPEFFMNVVFSLQSDSVNKGSQARQVMKLILCNFYQRYDQLHFNFSRKLCITFVKAALENQEPSSCSQTGILFCFLFSQPQRQTTADHDRLSKRKPITTVQLYCHQSVEKLELLSMATPSTVMRRRLKQVLFNLVKSKIIEAQNY